MRLYLDACCFNRPYDDQSQLRIRLESEAKLRIQEEIRAGVLELVWSYVLDYENTRNPSIERRKRIARWRERAVIDVVENSDLLSYAEEVSSYGLHPMDALHVACAITAGATHFLTTDDTILKRSDQIKNIVITDPIGFIKEAVK